MKNLIDWLFGLPLWEFLLIHILVCALIGIVLSLWLKDMSLSFFGRPKKGYWTIIGDVPIWIPGEEDDENL